MNDESKIKGARLKVWTRARVELDTVHQSVVVPASTDYNNDFRSAGLNKGKRSEHVAALWLQRGPVHNARGYARACAPKIKFSRA